MDKIIISDILARGIIGVNESERTLAQDILINLEIEGDLSRVCLNDEIGDSINYRTITKHVIQIAETAQRYTVEALAQDIASVVLGYPKVTRVKVRVQKPGAVRFTRFVGVEIERSKESA